MTAPVSVTFPNVGTKYMINDDITLDILLGPGTYTEYDGVCLLRMGWTHMSQSLVTKRVTTNTDISVADNRLDEKHVKAISVVFKASELPDAGEQYYQFCYSSNTHILLGYSNHFRFTATNVGHSVERSVEERLLEISKYSDRTADTKLDTMSNDLFELKTTVGKLTDILSAKTTEDMSQLMASRVEIEVKSERIKALDKELEKQSIMIKEQQSLIAKQSQDLKAGEELFAIRTNELRQQLTTTSVENTRLKKSIEDNKSSVNVLKSKLMACRVESEAKNERNNALVLSLEEMKTSKNDYKSKAESLERDMKALRDENESLKFVENEPK